MLVSEFVDRTQYQPTEKEFAAINEDYLNSPLNKDEFCRKWCKMNPTKAGDLKRKEREQKQKEKEQKRLLKLIGEAKKDAYIMLTTEFQEKLKSISRETKSAALRDYFDKIVLYWEMANSERVYLYNLLKK